MKNFILSIAFILGAIGANAGTALEADFNNPTELIAEDGCTTTTVTTVTQVPGGPTTTTTTTKTECD